MNRLACVVLAAGKGTRMRSTLPKVMHPVDGVPMINRVISVAEELAPERILVVVGPDTPEVEDAVDPYPTYVQRERKGTADALLSACEGLRGFTGDILVLYGDTPLITVETLERLISVRRSDLDPAVCVLGIRPSDPKGYGRLVVGSDGSLEAIVEEVDASDEIKASNLCNAGLMVLDAAQAWRILDRIDNENAKGEFYLTKAVEVAISMGLTCSYVEGPVEDALGANTPEELAALDTIARHRRLELAA